MNGSHRQSHLFALYRNCCRSAYSSFFGKFRQCLYFCLFNLRFFIQWHLKSNCLRYSFSNWHCERDLWSKDFESTFSCLWFLAYFEYMTLNMNIEHSAVLQRGVHIDSVIVTAILPIECIPFSESNCIWLNWLEQPNCASILADQWRFVWENVDGRPAIEWVANLWPIIAIIDMRMHFQRKFSSDWTRMRRNLFSYFVCRFRNLKICCWFFSLWFPASVYHFSDSVFNLSISIQLRKCGFLPKITNFCVTKATSVEWKRV